jgi:glycosyltransferase involved in cell wall biosynthesis
VQWDLFWDRPEERPVDPDEPVTDTRHFPFSCFAVATKPLPEDAEDKKRLAGTFVPTRPLLEVTPAEEFTGTVPIVMILYHREEDTRDVLEQLDRVTDDYNLVFVDNGFDDVDYIKGLGAAGYLRNAENVGIPRSINQGLELAEGRYIAVMHNDLFIYDEGWLRHIIEFMERRPDVGIVGLAGRHTIKEDGSLDEETLVVALPEYEDIYGPSWRFTEVATIDGICFVMRNIGLRLDESMGPLHYYDLDISMQYAEAGYRVYCANVECRHGREKYLRAGGEEAALTTGTDTDEAFLEAKERFLAKWGGSLPITRGFVDERCFLNRNRELSTRMSDLESRMSDLESEYSRLEDYCRRVLDDLKELEAENRAKATEIEKAKDYVSTLEAARAAEEEERLRYAEAYSVLEERYLGLAREFEARPVMTGLPPDASILERLGFHLRTEGARATLKKAFGNIFRKGS